MVSHLEGMHEKNLIDFLSKPKGIVSDTCINSFVFTLMFILEYNLDTN